MYKIKYNVIISKYRRISIQALFSNTPSMDKCRNTILRTELYMEYIKYESTLKAGGDEYKKIVFWNRFIRNPIETILTWLPAAATIVFICLGYLNTYLAVIYAACWAYPIYIFFFQFKSSVNYHLKNREASESAPCTITLTQNGILAEIPDFDKTISYEWDNFTTIYKKFGYYMLFEKSKMTVMLREADIPKDIQNAAADFIRTHVDMNKCKVLF